MAFRIKREYVRICKILAIVSRYFALDRILMRPKTKTWSPLGLSALEKLEKLIWKVWLQLLLVIGLIVHKKYAIFSKLLSCSKSFFPAFHSIIDFDVIETYLTSFENIFIVVQNLALSRYSTKNYESSRTHLGSFGFIVYIRILIIEGKGNYAVTSSGRNSRQ